MLNSVTIQGNLTRDPEIKYFEQDKVVAKCAIAHNTKVNGQDKPCYLEFSIWGRQAEAVANHFRKGNQIILEGQLAQDFWQDRHTGQQRSKHVLKANKFHFCGSKSQTPTTQTPVVTTTTPLGASQTAPIVQQPAVGAPIAPMAAPGAQVPVTAQQVVSQAQVAPVAAPHTVVAAPQQPTTAQPAAGAPVATMAAPTALSLAPTQTTVATAEQPAATTPAEMVQQLHHEIIDNF